MIVYVHTSHFSKDIQGNTGYLWILGIREGMYGGRALYFFYDHELILLVKKKKKRKKQYCGTFSVEVIIPQNSSHIVANLDFNYISPLVS